MRRCHIKKPELYYAKIQTGVAGLINSFQFSLKIPQKHRIYGIGLVCLQLAMTSPVNGQDIGYTKDNPEEIRISSGAAIDFSGKEQSIDHTKHAASSGRRILEKWSAVGEQIKVTREDTHQDRKVVTTIRVIRGGISAEYHRVEHDWGGIFYFKNQTTSIPETLFMQWTGMRY
jgi:hypothetical protein